ncbi:hypothetical protein KNE206_79270 [Kitasatospora sp. NE20-6]
MTSASIPGDKPAGPRTPNASANGSSVNTPASSSLARIAGEPDGNAAPATAAVIAGISGSPCGRIDTPHHPPGRTTARQPTE